MTIVYTRMPRSNVRFVNSIKAIENSIKGYICKSRCLQLGFFQVNFQVLWNGSIVASVVKCNVANWTASHKQGCRKAAAQWSLHKLARDRIVAANIDAAAENVPMP